MNIGGTDFPVAMVAIPAGILLLTIVLSLLLSPKKTANKTDEPTDGEIEETTVEPEEDA